MRGCTLAHAGSLRGALCIRRAGVLEDWLTRDRIVRGRRRFAIGAEIGGVRAHAHVRARIVINITIIIIVVIIIIINIIIMIIIIIIIIIMNIIS